MDLILFFFASLMALFCTIYMIRSFYGVAVLGCFMCFLTLVYFVSLDFIREEERRIV